MIYLYAHNFQDSSDISLWNCWIEGTSPGERWAFLSIAEKEKEAIDDIISHDCGRIPTVASGRPKHQQPMIFRRCEFVWAMMSSLYLFGSDFFLTNDFFFLVFSVDFLFGVCIGPVMNASSEIEIWWIHQFFVFQLVRARVAVRY